MFKTAMLKPLHHLAIWLLALLCLSACANTPVRTQRMQFKVAPALNLNTPLALDVVVIYDQQLAKAVQKFSARQWMERKSQLKRDYPLQARMWEWEIVPGEVLPEFDVPAGALDHAEGIFLFADYATPGLHRARLDPFEHVQVYLDENDMQIYANF